MDLGALKAVSDVGLALVGLAVVSVFGYRLLREFIDTLKAATAAAVKERDDWRTVAESAVAAFEHLADQLDVEPVIKPAGRPKRSI